MAQIASELVVAPSVPLAPILPRWRVLLWGALLTMLVAALAGGYLAYVASMATSGYSIQRLRAERDAWRTRNEQLRVELGKARSLTWVEHEAVGRLKMHKATTVVYLRSEDGSPAAAPPGPPAEPQAAGPR